LKTPQKVIPVLDQHLRETQHFQLQMEITFGRSLELDLCFAFYEGSERATPHKDEERSVVLFVDPLLWFVHSLGLLGSLSGFSAQTNSL
jgi:hypothetical protein